MNKISLELRPQSIMNDQQQLPFLGLLYYFSKQLLDLFQVNLSPNFTKPSWYSIYHNFPNPMTETLNMASEEPRQQ